jgi:hypothetical protein
LAAAAVLVVTAVTPHFVQLHQLAAVLVALTEV